ncbi:ThiF family adenylyltransferase [Aquipseudomonas campi]|uniref:ThiF family adenylyltransferase n=1 Tax=Aquipseudomonas campi TaxID=2731681 RepID=A0A6M8FPA5_9GAMM|nr:ThiF family adenylyltransferase [Pseudomonas campi]QKE61966.1 ThiF family adenylyltransferase [Pseudomonas campi]
MSHPLPPLDHDQFYRELTLRNAGFISTDEQCGLREAVILIAGCGSTGGSVIELLVRSGAEHLILADNGSYELNNANRQNMVISDIGRTKVEVFAERVRQINPYIKLELHGHGVTPDNVEAMVAQADVVVDAIDVTGRSGLEMKYLLHRVCQRQYKPVVCGYDMAAAQYIPVFDYRNPDLAVLDNQLSAEQVATLDPMQACSFLIPVECVPLEMYAELDRHLAGKDYTSQLGVAAHLFGTLATALIIDLLNGRAVRDAIYVDVWELIRRRDALAEREHQRQLEQGRQALAQWRQLPPELPDAFFLERSVKHYQAPLLGGLRSYQQFCIDRRAGIATYAIPNYQLDNNLTRQLLRFAFVHYAKVGFINPLVASSRQLHAEPLENLAQEDVHIVLVRESDQQLLAYSTLKAPIARGKRFDDAQRPAFGVETAFGRDLYAQIAELQDLPVEQVREIGRVTKAQIGDPVLEAKAGMLLLSAYGRLLCMADSGVAAMVGDGERQVTLRNLGFFGFRPQIMPARDASIPSEHLYANRYQGREVHPFWLRLDAIDRERVAQIESLIELEGDEFLSQLRAAKQQTPLQIGA